MAPGEGSPNDHPELLPEIPYEPDQGTGDAKKPEEELEGNSPEVPPDVVPG
jgi:hypothetical protein